MSAWRGAIVLHEAFGVLGPGPDSPPLERDALFAVCSVTKPITATLVMQLVEDGLLGLNRPAKDYLPEICGDGSEEILVHHLLTHTSGYPFQIDPPWLEHQAKKLKAGFEAPPCPEGQHPIVHQWLSLFWDAPRVARVGEMMVYSIHNYELLGEIVRRLSGRGIEELARQRIFDPLGMRDSYYVVPEPESLRVVQRASGIPFGPDFPAPEIGSRQWQETPQVPGLGALLLNRVMERASWGYGWQVVSPTKWKYFDGSLQPLGTFGHPGAGGVNYWIDRDHELVGAYFEVTTRLTADYNLLWNFDLFQNAITAAVEDSSRRRKLCDRL